MSLCHCFSFKWVASFQGITLLMMGSATELPKAPEQKTVFIEDMTDAERAQAVSLLIFIQLMLGCINHKIIYH